MPATEGAEGVRWHPPKALPELGATGYGFAIPNRGIAWAGMTAETAPSPGVSPALPVRSALVECAWWPVQRTDVMSVLKVSDAAVTAIRHLVEDAELPPRGGLRVVSMCENGMLGLMLCVVDAPEPFDYTLEEGGLAVYVDPRALQIADDQVLDIAPTERGGYRFELRS